MTALPDCWPRIPLAEVLTEVSRRIEVEDDVIYRQLGVRWYAAGAWIKARKDGSAIKSRYLYEARTGDFIYNRLFAWKGSFGIIQAEQDGCVVSGEFPLFEIDESRIHPDYLWLWFSQPAVWRHMESQSTGSTRTSRLRFQIDDLLRMEVPIPPYSEQRAIAHALRTIELAKVATGHVLGAARRLRWSVVEHFLRYGTVPRASMADVALMETDLGPVPSTWATATIGEFCATATGGTPSRDRPDFFGGSIPWVKSGEVRDGPISVTSEFLSEAGLAGSTARIFQPGTLVMAMYGAGATAGRVGLLEMAAATNQAITAILPDPTKALPSFLFEVLVHERSRVRAARHGSNQPNLSQQIIKEFTVPLPPLAEQRRIVDLVAPFSEKIAAEHAREEALGALFDSVLPALMNGTVRLQNVEFGVAA